MTQPLTNTLHLYRAILRECTYLPDSQARTYSRDHVIRSFRRYKTPRGREKLPLPRQVVLLHRGRKGLSVLRRANQGYLKPLQNVLLLTYARKGRRCREIMAKLTAPEPLPPHDQAADAPAKKDKFSRDWRPPPMIMALLSSQRKQAENLDRIAVGANKVRPEPAIPEKNTWGRPMPQRRVKNLMREWYAKQMSRLMPPLPRPEYQRLQALADGELGPAEGPRPRRKISSAQIGGDEISLMTEKFLLEGPPKSHTFRTYAQQGRPHELTPRFLRRIWAMIFKHVPQVDWDSAREEWNVRWDVKCRTSARVTRPAQDIAKMLFG